MSRVHKTDETEMKFAAKTKNKIAIPSEASEIFFLALPALLIVAARRQTE